MVSQKSIQKVKSRYLKASLGIGKTFQNEVIRIHRYNDVVKVTDLTNAGKRGKKCQQLHIQPTHNYQGDRQKWFDVNTNEFLEYARSSNPTHKIKMYIKDLQESFPYEISMTEQELRGVDVEPFGPKIEMTLVKEDSKSEIQVSATPHDFSIRNHAWFENSRGRAGGFFQDTGYYPVAKADAVVFYKWVKDNASKLANLKSLDDVLNILDKVGVRYNSH